jgi:hypothetical protein
MSADIWARVDEAIDTNPLQLRDIVGELLARAEQAEAVIEAKRGKRDTEMGRLRGQIKRERAHARMAQQHAMRCDASQAEAEAAQARAEARYAGLNAHHLRAVADSRQQLDATTERTEQAEAAVERVRADCEAVIAGELAADDNPRIWVNGGQAYAKRVLNILNAPQDVSDLDDVAEAFMAWVETNGYRRVETTPESNAPARTPASAATDAHGGAGETQEGSQ